MTEGGFLKGSARRRITPSFFDFEGQGDGESGTLARLTLHVNISAVAFNDAEGDEKSQARSFKS